jgi:hypothetical protein
MSAPFVAAPVLVGDQVVRVSQLLAGWLLGFGSVHTRRSYAGDVARWREFCAEHATEPLPTLVNPMSTPGPGHCSRPG